MPHKYKYQLVGFDAAALELRMLGHYVFPYDQGEYSRIVHEGRKEDATDPHSWMRDSIIGVNLIGEGDLGRDRSKTVVYADLYGAGDEKRGAIVLPTGTQAEKRAIGAAIREKVEERFAAKTELVRAIKRKVENGEPLIGLDKRLVPVRKPHAALNTLLQGAGAVTMKVALVVLDQTLQQQGLRAGRDYEFVANIHDEAQAEVLPEHVPLYMDLAKRAMVEAGERLRLKCPLLAEASSGRTWRDTH